MSVLAELLATLTAGLFTGAALYITLVEHPARLSCGSVIAVTEFRPSYKRAAVMQATLALVGAVAAIARWAMGSALGWLIGGILLGAVIPFTLLVILRTNKRLLDPSLRVDSGNRAPPHPMGTPPCCPHGPEPRRVSHASLAPRVPLSADPAWLAEVSYEHHVAQGGRRVNPNDHAILRRGSLVL